MLQQVGAVFFPLQRCAALQIFKRFALGRIRRTDGVGDDQPTISSRRKKKSISRSALASLSDP
jgi:hypothetical protein